VSDAHWTLGTSPSVRSVTDWDRVLYGLARRQSDGGDGGDIVTWPNRLPSQVAVPLLDIERLQSVRGKRCSRPCQYNGLIPDILNVYEHPEAVWCWLEFLNPKFYLFSWSAALRKNRNADED
jgi:hypothetical protein